MRICITAQGKDLTASVDPLFGRASVFLFVDSETREAEAVENVPSAHGAGVQAAQLLADQGAAILITGNIGPNAQRGLAASGIKVYLSGEGTVAGALGDLDAGRLTEALAATQPPHGGHR